jgi:hypothetical protein
MSIFLGAVKSNDYIDFTSRQSATIKLGKNIVKVEYTRGEVGDAHGDGKKVWYARVIQINNYVLPYGESAYLSIDYDYNPIYDFSLKDVERSIRYYLEEDMLYVIVESKKGGYIGKKIPKNIEVIFS